MVVVRAESKTEVTPRRKIQLEGIETMQKKFQLQRLFPVDDWTFSLLLQKQQEEGDKSSKFGKRG